jgi:hypothetical protein
MTASFFDRGPYILYTPEKAQEFENMTAIEISDELADVPKTKAAAQCLMLDTWLKKLVVESGAPESEREEKVKLEWLRAAAKESFDSIRAIMRLWLPMMKFRRS